MTLLLIAGLPGAGKSEYCKWLDRDHGHQRVEFDVQAQLRTSFAGLIGASGNAARARDAVRRLSELGPSVVLEWGLATDDDDPHHRMGGLRRGEFGGGLRQGPRRPGTNPAPRICGVLTESSCV